MKGRDLFVKDLRHHAAAGRGPGGGSRRIGHRVHFLAGQPALHLSGGQRAPSCGESGWLEDGGRVRGRDAWSGLQQVAEAGGSGFVQLHGSETASGRTRCAAEVAARQE